ncbi:glutathione S-transferase family protein [Teredinibacter purpureus]|jgi:Glutathione S-transferase|uniref:glutathione S-transferase family protein n=1 Tax=Teredinibacter purpureus TaxID=2731756 RepID=UPI0005F78DE4|nr:glutathione S-transferase family protein [Teredinibacter purpureus]
MPDLTLVIGNKNYSSWSLRPWFFLRYHQIPFKEVNVQLFTASTAQALEPYGSNAKVPVLTLDEGIVWDSLAILETLSEMYLGGKGWPVDVNARALARSISYEMHSSFQSLRDALPMNCRKQYTIKNISPTLQADIVRIKYLWAKCRRQYGSKGEWLFGEFSIADAMFAPVVLRFHGYNIELNTEERGYVQTVLTQPCIQAWMAAGVLETAVIDNDEVANGGQYSICN